MKWIRRHYHWVIALLAFLEMIIFGGLLNSANVFIIPITASLEVSRGSYALAMIPYSVMCTVSTLLSGFLFQKFGYKRCAVAGLTLTVVSLLLTATCRTLVGFCIGKFLLGVGYGACFTAGAVRIVKDWFFKHQGLVTGAVSMASGLGGGLMTRVLTELVGAFGWRIACMFLAILNAVMALCYLFFIKNRPEELGLTSYGFGVLSKNTKSSRMNELNWPGLSFHQWLHRPLLYLMVVSTLFNSAAIGLTSTNILPHFQDQGFSPSQAATYQVTYLLVTSMAKLLCGAVSDKVGPKAVSLFCLISGSLGQVLLSAASDPAMRYVGVSLLSFGSCMTTVMLPLLAAPIFGYRGIGDVNSLVLGTVSLANSFTGPISNLVFDSCGSYTPAFWGAALTNITMVFSYSILFALDRKEKKRLGSCLEYH